MIKLSIPDIICAREMSETLYCITRMFREHQTFANFAMVDQFATIKPAKPKLVNTHNPCQNAIVRSQKVKFSADLAHSQRFFTRKIF